LFVALTPAVGHFFVPVGAQDLGVGGAMGLVGVAGLLGVVEVFSVIVIFGVGLGLAFETLDLSLHFFGGPGGFGAAAMLGVGGVFLLESLELADKS